MQQFKNILFSPLGDKDNPAAVRRVADLAVRNGARLTLFGAISEPSKFQQVLHRSEYLAGVADAEQKAMAAKLARCMPKTLDIEIENRIAIGNPALSIIERALVADHDLVVVTTDEDDDDHATIKRLLRTCSCPVWVIRRTRARTQRVLAAVNPDPDEAMLNQTILELSSSMVDLYGGELHVVHAWELYGEAMMRSSAFLHTPEAEIESLLKQEQASHSAALDEMLSGSGLNTESFRVHIHKGPAAEVVRMVAEKHRINLLVMGTVARTGVAGLVIGNTAESVLDNVRCSVIAVKPPGFVSRVELVAK